MRRLITALAISFGLAQAAHSLDSSQGPLTVTPVVTGLEQPWGAGFLPDGSILISERGGRLLRAGPGQGVQPVEGVPPVYAQGQGGLLDVLVPSDFAETRQVFLSFSKNQRRGAGTALGRGTLSPDFSRFDSFEVIFETEPGFSGGRHFGSRIVEAPDGTLFLTVGDRGDRPSAQDRANHNGAVLRLTRDGAAPADNPFVGQSGIQPEIWSYGHRNPQGAALDLDGQLWTAEHGAQGGDEVNRVVKGANFGWPVISYGRHYSGGRIGEGTEKPGLEQPAFYWDPSMAPSGMMIYSGRLWPEWRGDAFVGSLKFSYISRLDMDGNVREVEQLESPETARVRHVLEGPAGAIWFLSVNDGTLYQVTPG
ncbi:MAG: PQQ-dependent sugar dehydrogenase [Pseudomonadota bacterium]